MYIKLGKRRAHWGKCIGGEEASENCSGHPASSKSRENWPGAWVAKLTVKPGMAQGMIQPALFHSPNWNFSSLV